MRVCQNVRFQQRCGFMGTGFNSPALSNSIPGFNWKSDTSVFLLYAVRIAEWVLFSFFFYGCHLSCIWLHAMAVSLNGLLAMEHLRDLLCRCWWWGCFCFWLMTVRRNKFSRFTRCIQFGFDTECSNFSGSMHTVLPFSVHIFMSFATHALTWKQIWKVLYLSIALMPYQWITVNVLPCFDLQACLAWLTPCKVNFPVN